MGGSRILVVEDEKKTRAAVQLYLEHAGFEVLQAATGVQALELALEQKPDLLIVDWMLPGLSGLEVCRRLRAASAVPIILLTARTLEEDKLRGLELGADDYVTKPFSPRELVARVRAVLRRSGLTKKEARRLSFGELEVDLEGREAWRGGQAVALTPTEFRLLECFVRAPGRVYTRAELLERAFGPDHDGFDRTVDVHIKNLRRKLEADPAGRARIVTVYGAGYKLAGGADAL